MGRSVPGRWKVPSGPSVSVVRDPGLATLGGGNLMVGRGNARALASASHGAGADIVQEVARLRPLMTFKA